MKFTPARLLPLAAPLILAPCAHASLVVTNTIRPVAVFTVDGLLVADTPVGIQAAFSSHQPYVYRLDILTQFDGLPPNQSFGYVGFSIQLEGGGLSRVPTHVGQIFPNYRANNPPTGLLDANAINVNDFLRNADPDPADLHGIEVPIDPDNLGNLYDADGNPQPDPRLLLASASPFRLGSIDVLYNGHTTSDISLTNAYFASIDDNTRQFQPLHLIPDLSQPSATVYFRDFPEPSTLALLPPTLLLFRCRT